MIGLDTSHVTAFTKILNDENHAEHVPGGKVVAAYKGGSDDVESSYTRVDKFTEQLKAEFGVRMVDTIEELCALVDAVMLESVDGRPHLAQARPVIEAGKPLFIDKPLAGSLADAIEIFRLAAERGAPIFSSSSYRYYDGMKALKDADVGEVRGAISWGPCHLEPHHPDLFWYGVHPTEALYAVMGAGCRTVTRVSTENTDVVVGVWSDGRVGTLRGLRNQSTPHKVVVFGTRGVAEQTEGSDSYAPLVREIIQFFETGISPVPAEETIEILAFMEAADESKRRGGCPVSIEEVVNAARGSARPDLGLGEKQLDQVRDVIRQGLDKLESVVEEIKPDQ
jgi:predicted dehydrogenase